MNNQVTNQVRLVEEIVFKTLPFLSHTLPNLQNVSQEIFRDGKYIGTVSPYNQGSSSRKVCNGDIIYRVKLLPQIYSFAGTLTTRDNYMPTYDMALELQVNNSHIFIQYYLQQNDPVNSVITQLKELFQQHVAQLEHDKIINPELLLERWNNSFSNLGVKITQICKFTLRDDPKRTKELVLSQDTEMKKALIKAQAEIQFLEDQQTRQLKAEQKEFERQEKWKQESFNREEEIRQQIHELHKDLRKIAAEELKMILCDRIREAYDRNEEISEVAEESMKLLNAFNESLQQGAIGNATSLNNNIQKQSDSISNISNTDMLTNTTDDECSLTPKQPLEGQILTEQNIQQMEQREVDTEQIRIYD